MDSRANRIPAFVFAAGVTTGALLAVGYRRVRSGFRCEGHPSLAAAEHCRDALPSTILLVRHGESEGNADHTLYRTKPDNLVRLTERGVIQAREAGSRIRGIIGDKSSVQLYVSPYERTLETAGEIRSAFESQILQTSIEPRIREQEFGNLQTHEFELFRERQKAVGRFWYRFPNGESGADVHDRVKSWWDEAVLGVNSRAKLPPVDTLVVVTHGITMRFVLSQLYGWSPTTFHSVWNAGNCDIYVLRKDLSLPGRSPYALDKSSGNKPCSTIDLLVKLRGIGKEIKVVLEDYLSVPQPRTVQLELVKAMIAEQNPEINAKDIVSVNFRPDLS